MPPPSLPRTTQSLGILPLVVYKKRIWNHLYLFYLFFVSFFIFIFLKGSVVLDHLNLCKYI